MIQPCLQDDAFLADVRAAVQSPGLHLWWLGQSGFLVQWEGRHLLMDPYLSDSLTRKYAATDKPHVRLTERVVAPDRLDFIHVVTSSHNHTDHLDAETLIPLLRANPTLPILAPEANRSFVTERLGVPPSRVHGVDAGASITLGGFSFHALPAAHETVERDEAGRCLFLGYVVRCGPWTLYHSGDTVLFEGLVAALRPWRVDVALLPINGRAPERRVAGNFWGRGAAQLAYDIGARVAIPCHYGMFEFNTSTPDDFTATARALDQPVRVLRAGERWSSVDSGLMQPQFPSISISGGLQPALGVV